MMQYIRKTVSTITWILLAMAILSAVLIAAFNKGASTSNRSGAGDIWWVDVPAVEESYRQLTRYR